MTTTPRPTPLPASTPAGSITTPLSEIHPNAFDFAPDLREIIAKVLSGEIDPKEASTAANAVRLKIQKARVLLQSLPDIERSIQEQREEIREREDRIERQRDMVRGVGERARDAREGMALD